MAEDPDDPADDWRDAPPTVIDDPVTAPHPVVAELAETERVAQRIWARATWFREGQEDACAAFLGLFLRRGMSDAEAAACVAEARRGFEVL